MRSTLWSILLLVSPGFAALVQFDTVQGYGNVLAGGSDYFVIDPQAFEPVTKNINVGSGNGSAHAELRVQKGKETAGFGVGVNANTNGGSYSFLRVNFEANTGIVVSVYVSEGVSSGFGGLMQDSWVRFYKDAVLVFAQEYGGSAEVFLGPGDYIVESQSKAQVNGYLSPTYLATSTWVTVPVPEVASWILCVLPLGLWGICGRR